MLLFFTLVIGITVTVFVLVHLWYFRFVFISRSQISHLDGKFVPGKFPKTLLGNIVDIYNAENRLSAYNSFHKNFGEIVQIFWSWRQNISISNYSMARQILIKNQKNYQKFTPNSIIQRLFGESVLTNTGDDWKRQRLLMDEVFSKKHIISFHHIFLSYSEQLATKWKKQIDLASEKAELNIYPELLSLFLDIIGKVAIGNDFAALEGKADQFLENIQYIVNQSTNPAHQFAKWWKYIPISSNRKLQKAFNDVDIFLYDLINHRKKIHHQLNSAEYNLLDLLIKGTDLGEDNTSPLTDQQLRDNLLAIIINGHETVAISIALSLYLLAKNPSSLTQVQAEIDRVIQQDNGQLTANGVLSLEYLDCVIKESLRLCPPMAGLQRISINEDLLNGWSIPQKQAVGISLIPLHLNSDYFGESPEKFSPERYFHKVQETAKSCPLRHLFSPDKDLKAQKADIHEPLTFGDGARKCLGKYFAMYEMKVALAVLLHRFHFEVAPNFDVNLELGKFGLFITMFPQGGVKMVISLRLPR